MVLALVEVSGVVLLLHLSSLVMLILMQTLLICGLNKYHHSVGIGLKMYILT